MRNNVTREGTSFVGIETCLIWEDWQYKDWRDMFGRCGFTRITITVNEVNII